MLVRRLLATLCVAGIACVLALGTDLHGFDSSSVYFLLATVLLTIGLFSTTYDLSIKDLRYEVRLIALAVTLGVLVKAALVTGVMYLIFRDPAYIVLGVAIVQIDPLSVAVMKHRYRLSVRAKAILSAWSSLDDPVTAILAICLSPLVLTLSATNTSGQPGTVVSSDADSLWNGLSGFASGLLGNGLLVVGAALVWLLLSWIGKHRGYSITDGAEPASRSLQVVGIFALAVIAAVAVDNFWMLGIAVVGLFFRPGIGSVLSWVTPVAFILATFVLGLVLADGVNLVPALVLGAAAFASQIVVGGLAGRTLPSSDRFRLALGQQSGITAVILALLLETDFPGTVAVMAPAILLINVLHLVSNTLLDKAAEAQEYTSLIRSSRT